MMYIGELCMCHQRHTWKIKVQCVGLAPMNVGKVTNSNFFYKLLIQSVKRNSDFDDQDNNEHFQDESQIIK